ncbi:FAD-dependent oxidoreductase [Spiroplasma endosymbiont of Panorpa germanica]|uniref:FAD-dependent oxidoreductase n=1 Tax=Spiroplasma endosymbiont of Panorpa germanica TaxID=3066314 RepID=UPI0030D1EE10
MKTIIIGTNHTGTTAARTLRRTNKTMEIVTYDKNDNISFLGCGIALWVKGDVKDEKELFYASPEILEQENIKVKMRHEMIELNEAKKTVRIKNLETGEIFDDNYDKLIIANGSWPIIPPIEGINLEGINVVKIFQHGQKIYEANQNKNIKKIAVIGAGYIGIELVDAFAANGKDVILIDVADRIMPRYYDHQFTDLVEADMKKTGVTLKLNEGVKKFNGKDGKVTEVVTDKGTYQVDMVIWAVGFKPQTEMFKGKLDLAANGAIITNEFMQTSNKDIYAIGDCVEVLNYASGKKSYLALATTAVRTGIIAALNITNGNKLPSSGFAGANGISVFGWNLAGVGMSETACKADKVEYDSIMFTDNDRPEFMETYNQVWIKIIWEKKSRRIIGAQIGSLANHTEVMYMFSLAIQKGLTIDELPLVDIFFLPHFNKPYNFITLAGLEVLGLNYFKK